MKSNYSLKKLTTIKIGGPAKYFVEVKSERELIKAINWAKNKPRRFGRGSDRNVGEIKWLVIGEGSNLVPSDKGFNGLIIKNKISNLEVNKEQVTVGAGHTLLKLINNLNRLGLSGIEKMAGIPGTVGGAVYGSAGAYGQEIKDKIKEVKVFDGTKTFWISNQKCNFGYRNSIFKRKKDLVIVAVKLKLEKTEPKELIGISKEIIKMRGKKYPRTLLCPGSFFKNIVIEKIRPISLRNNFLSKIPKDKINHGKVTAGYLLESVGAKSMKSGKIKVAEYHGNLIYNMGDGKYADIINLTNILKDKVKKKFGIVLEEEVQYI